MAYNQIPILTTLDKNYPYPKQNEDGVWVVSASSVNKDPNKIILYDTVSRQYTPVTRYTVSPDYYKEVREYEDRLAKQSYGMANTSDPNQVNSAADLLTILGAASPLRRSDKTVMERMATFGNAVTDYFKEFVVSPWTKPDIPFSTRAVMSLNNAMVNLSETMDTVTMANTVKGLAQEGVSSIPKGLMWQEGQGRVQYDWDIETGYGGLVDGVVNTILEIFSDPTTYIDLGTSAFIKSATKNTAPDIIMQSAKQSGFSFTRKQADELTSGITKSVLRGGDSLSEALLKMDVAKVTPSGILVGVTKFDNLPSQTYADFLTALSRNSKMFTESRTMRTIMSVRQGSEMAQRAAVKATALSSNVGLGYTLTKEIIKTVKGADTLVARSLNKVFKNTEVEKINLTNMDEVVKKVYNETTTLTEVLHLPKDTPDVIIQRLTENVQREAYTEAMNILDSNRSIAEIYQAADEWAKKQGASEFIELIEGLANNKTRVSDSLRNMLFELANKYEAVRNEVLYERSKELIATIDKFINSDKSPAEVNAFIDAINEYKAISGFSEHIAPEQLIDITEELANMYNVKNVHDLKVMAVEQLKGYTLLRGENPFDAAEQVFVFSDSFKLSDVLKEFPTFKEAGQATLSVVKQVRNLSKRVGNWVDPKMLEHTISTLELWIKNPVMLKPNKLAELTYNINIITQSLVKLRDVSKHASTRKIAEDILSTPGFSNSNLSGLISNIISMSESATPKIDKSFVKFTGDALGYADEINEILNNNQLKAMLGETDLRIIRDALMIRPETAVPTDVADRIMEAFITVRRKTNVLLSEQSKYINTSKTFQKNIDDALGFFSILSDELKKKYTKLVIPKGTVVHADPIVSRVLNTKADHLVTGGLIKGLRDKGLPEERINELFVAVSKADPSELLSPDDNVLVKDVLDSLIAVHDRFYTVKYSTDHNDVPYFIQGLLLKESVEFIASNGINLRDAKDLLRNIDHGARWAQKNANTYTDLFLDAYNKLDKLVTEWSGDNVIKLDSKAVDSALYVVRQSKIQSLVQLLNTEGVPDALESIRHKTGIGELLDLLSEAEVETDVSYAVGTLTSLAHSNYITNRFIALIQESKVLSDAWKTGLYDSIAGKATYKIEQIYDPMWEAGRYLNESARFINNLNNKHPKYLQALSTTGDKLEEATKLYKIMAGKADEHVQETWKVLTDALEHNKDTVYNVAFSAAQTSKNGGTIYEMVFVLPNGKTVRLVDTKVRQMFIDTLDEETARQLYGASKEIVRSNILDAMKYDADASTMLCDNTEDFLEAVYLQFKQFREAGQELNKVPRLVGFNNAPDSLHTDEILDKFLRYNELKANIVPSVDDYKNIFSTATVDAAQLLRAEYDGAVSYTYEMKQEVAGILTKVKNYLEMANTNVIEHKARLVPDFNDNVLYSIRSLTASLDNALELQALQRQNRTREMVFTAITEAQYAALTLAFDERQLVAFRTQLTSLLDNIGDALSHIKNTNDEFGSYLLIQKNIAKLLGEPNIMQVLYKYFVSGSGVPALSFKKVYDPAVYREWFDVSARNIDQSIVVRRNDIAEQLQNKKHRIAQPLLIMEIPQVALRTSIDVLRDEFLRLPNYKFSTWAMEVSKLSTQNNQLNNYAIAQLLYDSIRKSPIPVERLKVIETRLSRAIDVSTLAGRVDGSLKNMSYSDALLDYLKHADKTVMYKDNLHALNVPVLQSKLFREDNALMDIIDKLNVVHKAAAEATTAQDSLIIDQVLRDRFNISLPSLRAKEQVIKAYGAFIGNYKNRLDEALEIFSNAVGVAKSDYDVFQAKKAYSTVIHDVSEELHKLGQAQATFRINNIMSMNAQDYATYLYKHSQGVQLFDLNAKVFDDISTDVFGNFVDTLKEAEALGLKVIENTETKEMIVYLSKDADLIQLAEWAKDFKVPQAVSPAQFQTLPQAYVDLVNLLDEHFDGAFGISTHRIMSASKIDVDRLSKYDELLNYLSDDVRNDLIPFDTLREQGLVNTFSNNTVGDYDSYVGKIFTMDSSNVLNNVAVGFNYMYRQLRGIDTYKGLYFNKDMAFGTWVKNISSLGKVTDKEVAEVIEHNNMVVAEYVDGMIKSIDISNKAEYARALTADTALLDYHTYMRSVEVINDRKLPFSAIKQMNKYLSVLKFGQLMSTGWLLRNVGDSTVKGWVQAGLDPMYMFSMFNRTKRVMSEYYYTLAYVFKENVGKLDDVSVNNFYKAHKGEELLDQATFKKLLTFYNSSVSTVLPAQLAIYDNIAVKLYGFVKDNRAGVPITQGMVEQTIDIVRELQEYPKVLGALKEKFGDDAADILIDLYSRVPKKLLEDTAIDKLIDKVSPIKWIVENNNNWESFIRTHTFLYHSVYLNETTSAGIAKTAISQFNRSTDTKTVRFLEMLLPFSSFQMDNFLFWTDTRGMKSNVIALIEDAVNGMTSEDTFDTDELSRNMSLQYLYMSGNLMLSTDDVGLTLKTGSSLHDVLTMAAAPHYALSGMLNVPMDTLITLFRASIADEQKNYWNIKPISQWTPEDYTDELVQLIPLAGVLYQRYNSSIKKWTSADELTPWLIPTVLSPAIFGYTKTEASRPIGYDWYAQDDEYRRTHRYVFGVSYVPKWMRTDPRTYADTYTRLQNMGYSAETASHMLQNGWYMKAPNYQLKHYQPYAAKPRSAYYKKAHIKRSYPMRKPKKVYMKYNKSSSFSADTYRHDRYNQPRRVYRTRLYNELYTRTGVARADLISWRGANRSSRQLLLDRRTSQKIRRQRIVRQIRG